jgi:hypothetical protein
MLARLLNRDFKAIYLDGDHRRAPSVVMSFAPVVENIYVMGKIDGS